MNRASKESRTGTEMAYSIQFTDMQECNVHVDVNEHLNILHTSIGEKKYLKKHDDD